MTKWKDADGKVITDEQLFSWISSETKSWKQGNEHELIVGVDSHLHGCIHYFITVVCLYRKGRGGFYYFKVNEQNRKEFKGTYPVRVRARMFHEASLAIETATEIQEKTGITPIIHLDASPASTGELSSMFSEELRGYAVGCGFEAVLKPWSFVASGVANKHTKVSSGRKNRHKK
jgi:predicted RNase H-related nuclease YkuK (DUF458 family)